MTKAESTKQHIIEKSAPIFNKKGVAGTVIDDIILAADVSKGSLYRHFENKDDLAIAVVDYNLETWKERTFSSAGQCKSAKKKLFAMIDFLSDPLIDPVEGGCPMLNFGMEADDTNPLILEKVNKTMQGTIQALTAIITEGIKAGEFKANWKAKTFATQAYAMLEGGILLSRVSKSPEQMTMLANVLKEIIAEHTF